MLVHIVSVNKDQRRDPWTRSSTILTGVNFKSFSSLTIYKMVPMWFFWRMRYLIGNRKSEINQGLCRGNVKLALLLKWMLTVWCLVKASLREAVGEMGRSVSRRFQERWKMLKSNGKKEMWQITRSRTVLNRENSILSAFFQQIPFDILYLLDNLIRNLRKELQNFNLVKENLSFVTFLL